MCPCSRRRVLREHREQRHADRDAVGGLAEVGGLRQAVDLGRDLVDPRERVEQQLDPRAGEVGGRQAVALAVGRCGVGVRDALGLEAVDVEHFAVEQPLEVGALLDSEPALAQLGELLLG